MKSTISLFTFLALIGCGIRGAPVPPENPLLWPEKKIKKEKAAPVEASIDNDEEETDEK